MDPAPQGAAMSVELMTLLGVASMTVLGLIIAFIKWALGQQVKRVSDVEVSLKEKVEREEMDGAVTRMGKQTQEVLDELRRTEARRDGQMGQLQTQFTTLSEKTGEFHMSVAKDVAALRGRNERTRVVRNSDER